MPRDLFWMTLAGLASAYVVGAIPVGFLVARTFGGLDIRRAGSGNIGATNVLRTLGKLPAVLTLCGDIGKGYVAVSVARALVPAPWGAAAGAVLAVVGNCWPVFLRFRGGKGVATGLGAFLALAPWATAPTALVWLVVVASFRYISLASIMACLCLPVGVALLGFWWGTVDRWESVGAAVATAIIIITRHRANLERLAAGREPRLGERASPA
jgi:acyl phosphate:glycerol-3-phosphate acyltransferase